MQPQPTKKCPLCAETIPTASATCEYCGAQFKITSNGYCTNCHALRDADETGHCRVCGNIVTDWHVESQFVETPAPRPAPPPAARAPVVRVPAPPKKKTWVWWVIGGVIVLGLFAVVAVVLMLFGIGVLKFPASILTTNTSTPDFIVTSQSETASAGTSIVGPLTVWHNYGSGSPDEAALLAIIHNAETENPGLEVIVSNRSTSGNYIEEYLAASAAGAGPDILLSDSGNLWNLTNSGAVLGLDHAILDDLVGVRQYALDALTMDGILYGLPESVTAVALYYNRSLVPNPPATTDDLLDLIKQGINLAIPDGPPYFFYGFWSAFGGQLMDESGRCIADEGGFAPAVQYLLDLQDAGANIRTEYGEATTRFTEGDIALIINGPWTLHDYKAALGSDLGVALLPSGPAGPSRPLAGVNAFFVNSYSNDTENAVRLALYLTSRDSAQIFTDQALHARVRNDVYVSDPLVETFSLAGTLGLPFPPSDQIGNYWGPFTDLFDNIISGGMAPEEAVRQACEQMNTQNGLP